MGRSDIIAGLDMGSSRVTCIIAGPDEETRNVRVLSAASLPCPGLKGGVVVNIAETARAVTQVIEETEARAKQTVSGVYLGVRGAHLQSFNNRGAYNIARTDKEITAEDVSSVIENAKAIPISNDREILHVIPQGFSLDRQRGVPNPVGMEGSLLEVEVHIVTASSSHLNNLIKAVNQAGFEVLEPVYSLLAVGEMVVTPEEKELGCLLIDLGGQTVSAGIYFEGSLRFSKEIPLGSDFITRDLAYGLRTSLITAQNIKEKHGIALTSLLNGEEDVTFLGMDGRTPRKVKAKTLVEIIQPRVEEIFSAVREEVQNSTYADLPGGAVLTGGGVCMKGMAEAGEQILEMQVRTGLPRKDLVLCEEEALTPSLATALGLVSYPSLKTWMQVDLMPSGGAKKSSIRRKVSGWFENLF
ncbi:MAG: cell division protein FtsA [Elusimicrobia bacterium]|nr:cell division protein FtsA [Elusimicrobiota bacterium]